MINKKLEVGHAQKQVTVPLDDFYVRNGKKVISVSYCDMSNSVWASIEGLGCQMPFKYLHDELKPIIQKYMDRKRK